MSNLHKQSISVKLEDHTSLEFVMKAIRTCYDSFGRSDDMGAKDLELIKGVGTVHSSTLEHLVYNFYITGISRLCLQELARHRIASFSVESTRYTLRKLNEEEPFVKTYFGGMRRKYHFDRAFKYIQSSGDSSLDKISADSLETLRVMAKTMKYDDVKYILPESYRTKLAFTINARSLRNLLQLRSSKLAHKEIRLLAQALYTALPDDHKFLFEDVISLDTFVDKDSAEIIVYNNVESHNINSDLGNYQNAIITNITENEINDSEEK